MINSLNIKSSSNTSNGIVCSSASWSGYTCIVGNFIEINGFITNGIAIINTSTGDVDSTSELALTLASLFPVGSTIAKVIYETSDGHPCLIFLNYAFSNSRCFVFFLETLTGYDVLVSGPLAFSSPITAAMNTSRYIDMKVCDSQRALIVIGSFYISGGNGCVALDIDSLFDNLPANGLVGSSVYSSIGGAQASSAIFNYLGLAIDDSNSKLYLFNNKTKKIDIYTISPSALSYVSSLSVQADSLVINSGLYLNYPNMGGMMEHGNDKLFIVSNYNPTSARILIYNTSTLTWQSNYIKVVRNQFLGYTSPYGIEIRNGKLYIWGSFTNAFYPQTPSFSISTIKSYAINKRQGLAVFDISSSVLEILGEDLALSTGVVYLRYQSAVFAPFEISSTITHAAINDSDIHLFINQSDAAYSVASSGTVATNIQRSIWKNGIQYNHNPIKTTLDGKDAQTFEANLIF